MSIASINNVASTLSSSATAPATPAPSKTLNQNDFLKLLVAQMTSQDPMNPQSNTDFAAQMAQFSALTTSQTTESDVAKLHADQQVQQANSLIGRAVTLANSDNTIATGTVNAVSMNQGVPQLMVNGIGYDLSQVLLIQPPATPTN